MRIALIGTRGVPAKYGGFETCAEEIGARLVEKGHSVTVYCRKSFYPKRLAAYRGMELVYLPNPVHKYVDTVGHTFLSVCRSLFKGYDIYMVFNAANSLFLLPLRLINRAIVINTDGLEWKRSKWDGIGKFFHRISEKIACLIANRLVTDSPGIQSYYQAVHNAESTQIAYGAYIPNSSGSEQLKQLGLEPNGYFLQITRFEPENNPLLTIKAFKRLKTNKKLVLVGGNPYENKYVHLMTQEADNRVVMPGFIYEKELLNELWCNCYAYIHGNEVGGTNPALLQAMAFGCFTVAIDVTFNRHVLADAGLLFPKGDIALALRLQWVLEHKDQLDAYKKRAVERIKKYYSWDRIAMQYETLFYEVNAGCHPWPPRSTRKF